MKIELFTHHFTIKEFDASTKRVILEFAHRYAERTQGPDGSWVIDKVYAGSNKARTEYRFHINCYKDFLILLTERGINTADIKPIKHELFKPTAAKLTVNPYYQPDELQQRMLSFLHDGVGHSKLLEIQTGKGKTYTSIQACADRGHKFAVATKGGLVEKWIPDLGGKGSILGLDQSDDLVVVRGLDQLAILIHQVLNNLCDYTVYLFSTNTLAMFYQYYADNDGDMSYFSGIHPSALWELLGVGAVITDEWHMLFHMNFMRELYTHVPLTIGLTATYIPSSPFMKMVYQTVFPPSSRTPPGEFDKYISVKALFYGKRMDTKVRYIRRGMYSHILFEETIMANKKTCTEYVEGIMTLVNRIYDDEGRHKPGQKMLIFASTIELCTLLTARIRLEYGDKYVVNRFVGVDPYSHVSDSDIIVSTPGSLGTAHDIKHLRYILLTTAIGKEDTNIQLLGRLRRLRDDPDTTPEMYYFVCRDIVQHMKYHVQKVESFKPRVKDISEREIDIRL